MIIQNFVFGSILWLLGDPRHTLGPAIRPHVIPSLAPAPNHMPHSQRLPTHGYRNLPPPSSPPHDGTPHIPTNHRRCPTPPSRLPIVAAPSRPHWRLLASPPADPIRINFPKARRKERWRAQRHPRRQPCRGCAPSQGQRRVAGAAHLARLPLLGPAAPASGADCLATRPSLFVSVARPALRARRPAHHLGERAAVSAT
jgi:hypothetical protein